VELQAVGYLANASHMLPNRDFGEATLSRSATNYLILLVGAQGREPD
jgi:hypothetical protein